MKSERSRKIMKIKLLNEFYKERENEIAKLEEEDKQILKNLLLERKQNIFIKIFKKE